MPEPMRIGHYAPDIWAQGGIGTYIRRLGRGQTDRGHDVTYLGRDRASEPCSDVDYTTVPDDEALFSAAEARDLDILHLHKSVRTLPEDRVPTVRTMHGHQGGCPSGSRYLARTGEPCDRPYTLSGCLWGHFVDRCGSVRPGSLTDSFTRIRREVAQAERIPTYTVSHFLRDKMRRAGCASDRLCTLHSPAPRVESPFTPVPGHDPPRFLFLGRLVPEKGLDWLLRAVAGTDASVHLDVAGTGPKEEEMRALSTDLGVDDRVSFHGWVPADDVSGLMRAARAVVFPSVWHEPAGLITLEAAAQGRPLIASRVGGIPEYADDAYATLVDARDVSGLARAIDRLASAPEHANRMGKNGYRAARSTFSMDRFLDRVDAFYGRARAPSTTG
jgi:glycosyltransferase involved in cell wall biosynthesis